MSFMLKVAPGSGSGLLLEGFCLNTNPISASYRYFGCEGAPVTAHLIVYWVGPLTASYLTAIMYNDVADQIDLHPLSKPAAKKTSKGNCKSD